MAKATLTDHMQRLLAQADRHNKLPAGTMASIMQQEVGNNLNTYLNDPSTYHYAKNAKGQRVAGHTGKVSTAFGPFGILESTGAKPGYGVKPLANKSIEEQVRFASEYLAARSKDGGLERGLAGYGEGARYANQVARRIPGQQVAVNAASVQSPGLARIAPERLAQMGPPGSYTPAVQAPAQLPPELVAQAQAQGPTLQAAAERSWTDFQQAMPAPAMRVSDLDYGSPQVAASSEVPQMAQVNDRQRIHGILKRFGLGTYAQDNGERFQVSLPEFARS